MNLDTTYKLTPKSALGVTLSALVGSLSAFAIVLSAMFVPVNQSGLMNQQARMAISGKPWLGQRLPAAKRKATKTVMLPKV